MLDQQHSNNLNTNHFLSMITSSWTINFHGAHSANKNELCIALERQVCMALAIPHTHTNAVATIATAIHFTYISID